MTKEEFIRDIKTRAENMRKKYPMLRYGQAIFNAVDIWHQAVAREAQYKYKIDCFYDDSKVDKFLDTCYKILLNHE